MGGMEETKGGREGEREREKERGRGKEGGKEGFTQHKSSKDSEVQTF